VFLVNETALSPLWGINRTIKALYLVDMGPSIEYVTLFWTNFDPLPCHTLSHISGLSLKYITHLVTSPHPTFIIGQRTRQNPLYTKSISI